MFQPQLEEVSEFLFLCPWPMGFTWFSLWLHIPDMILHLLCCSISPSRSDLTRGPHCWRLAEKRFSCLATEGWRPADPPPARVGDAGRGRSEESKMVSI